MLIREARLRQIIRSLVLEAAGEKEEKEDDAGKSETKSSSKRGSWRKDKPDPLHHLKGKKTKATTKSKKSSKIDELCEDDEELEDDESLSGEEEEDEENDESQSEDDEETDSDELKKALKK